MSTLSDKAALKPVLQGPFRRVLDATARFVVSNPGNMAVCLLVATLLVIATAAFLATLFDLHLTTYDPIKMNIGHRLRAPSAEHWMGTDTIGRDVFSRIVAGSWITFSIALAVLCIASTFGAVIGVIAGYTGGLVDEILMRITDLFLAFPALILAAAISATFGGSLIATSAALAVVFWPWYARLTRSRVLSLKEQDFVTATAAMGASRVYIVCRTLLPMVWPLVLVQAATDVGFVMLSSAGLSFLGLGAKPPTPEWGAMIFDSLSQQPRAWWLAAFPGGALAFTALAFNLLGDSLRDHLDPAMGATDAGL